MTPHIAVIGAGVIGRFTAWRLAERGASVTLIDREFDGNGASCSAAAAGMLAPLAEGVHAGCKILNGGLDSLARWQRAIPKLPQLPAFSANGSWITALPGDEHELESMAQRLTNLNKVIAWHHASQSELADVEPTLIRSVRSALFLKSEGYINPEQTLPLLLSAAITAGVKTQFGVHAVNIAPYVITTNESTLAFDQIIDTRGLGAILNQQDLRGVRGELIHLDAPDLTLTRPVRILHPRYPLYIVPRTARSYVIGATQLESASEEPISVRSALELLNAAYALHPALRQAQITRLTARARPAYFDNQPKIRHKPGYISINGMFRHGWLLAPLMAEAATALVFGDSVPEAATSFVEDNP